MTLALQLTIATLTLAVLLHATTARQIRLNRYGVQIAQDDDAVVATVRELQPTPYPAAGYRPGRAFNLPNEIATTTAETATMTSTAVNEADSTTESATAATTVESVTVDENLLSTSTATPLAPFLFELSDTQTNAEPRQLSDTPADATAVPETTTLAADAVEAKTPYPAAGYRPSRAFNLPNEYQAGAAIAATATTTELSAGTTTELPAGYSAKAPYPAAGYRPRCAFHLPNELPATPAPAPAPTTTTSAPLARTANEVDQPVDAAANANHPACGTSTNPLAPKPPQGSIDEPDAVWIVAATPANNAATAAVQIPIRTFVAANVPHAQPFIAAVPVARQFIAYSPAPAPLQTWQLH